MDLRELITTGAHICQLDIDIRDYSNGKNGYLIDKIVIGPRAVEDRIKDENQLPRWKTIRKEINYKDVGRDYWGIILGPIPKELLSMEVKHWDLRTGWRTNNGLNEHDILRVCLSGKDNCILVEEEPVLQLEGQMELEDWLGGTTNEL